MKNLVNYITESNYRPTKHLTNSQMDDYWCQAYELMGGEGRPEDCQMLQAIEQMLDTDTCVWILENLNRDYELNLFGEDA